MNCMILWQCAEFYKLSFHYIRLCLGITEKGLIKLFYKTSSSLVN